MKLSTKGRYAVTAMFDMAFYGEGKPISAAEISERQGIPLPYLEQLLSKLKKGRLVKTVRGPSGGYSIANKPSKLSIGDIIKAADGPVALANCTASGCKKGGCCSTRGLWKRLSDKISRVLDSTTLADLCKENRK